MKHQFILASQAQKDLKKLPAWLETKIREKIKYYLSAPDPLVFAEPLVDLPPATHRFRFGKLRIKFFRRENIFYVTNIKYRDKVYKR